jgi:hypothetical protein
MPEHRIILQALLAAILVAVLAALMSGRLQQPEVELFSIPAMGQTDMLSYLLFGRPMDNASQDDSEVMGQAAPALSEANHDPLDEHRSNVNFWKPGPAIRYADSEVTIHAQYQVHYQFAVDHRGADLFSTKHGRGRNTVPAVEFFGTARIADHDLAGSRFGYRHAVLQHRVSPPPTLISTEAV